MLQCKRSDSSLRHSDSAIGLLQVLPEQTNTTSLEGYRLSMGSVEFFNLDLGRELV